MSEFCSKRHILIMMTLTPTKSIEPYQVMFKKSPTLQLIVRLKKKTLQLRDEGILMHRLCSTQFQVELLLIINCVETLLAFDLKKYP